MRTKFFGVATIALLAVVVSIALVSSGLSVTAATDEEDAITLGVTWLADQQVLPAGYFEDPAHAGYYPVASTGFALLKLEEHAAQQGKDPFDDNPASPTYYEYADKVIAGWDYLSTQMFTETPLADQSGNDPEQYTDGDDIGHYFNSGARTYETGIVMMALEASGAPGRTFPNHPRPAVDDTFRDVLEDCVDYMAWAQCDSGTGRGGWRYSPYDNAGGSSDNSVSQWPVLGLMSAEAPGWGINAPDFVKDELENQWLAYSQDSTSGCFGYSAPGSYASFDYSAGPFAVTASGLIQLTYCGVPTTDSRWSDGAQCICTNWGTSNIGNGYAMYALMKAAMTAQPQPPNPVWDFCGHEWQPEYDAWLIANQVKPDGYWPEESALPWHSGHWNKVLATEYALLILQKVAPPVPTPTPPPGVGGVLDIAVDGPDSLVASAEEASGGSSVPYSLVLAGGLMAAAIAVAAGGLYARRRLS